MAGPFDLGGSLALVTGGGGRVGSAIALALAEAGARVAVTGRSREPLDAVAGRLGAAAAGVFPADLTEEATIGELFDSIEAAAGGVDILVNNAGRASPKRFGQVAASDFDAVLRLNVVATYLCAQRAAATMTERGHGKIVNVGSIYGAIAADRRIYEDSPDMVQASPVYVAAKSALVNLTRDLAVQLAPSNIQVNLLSPGGVEADQEDAFKRRYSARVPAGRMAQAAEVGAAAVFLAAPASNYVVGQELLVDGGLSAW